MSRFFTLLYIVVSLLAFTSCAGDDATSVDGDGQGGDSETVRLTLTLNMGGDAVVGSRATTWGDEYKTMTATDYERTIAEGKLQVLLYSADGSSFIGELQDLIYTRRSGDEANIYDVIGSLEIPKTLLVDGKLECKIVVLANYDTPVKGTKSLTDIANETFSYNAAGMAAETSYIPMFGVKTFSGTNAIKLSYGYQKTIERIDMLRSMAKICVKFDLSSGDDGMITADDDIGLKAVRITNGSTVGYMVPKGYADVKETTKLSMVDLTAWDWGSDCTFNPHGGDNPTVETLSFIKENATTFYIYVPEYDISNGRPKIQVLFDFQQSTDSYYTFDFDQYVNSVAQQNTGFNIERNHVYTFIIKKTKFKLFAVVAGDWTNTFYNEYTFEDDV